MPAPCFATSKALVRARRGCRGERGCVGITERATNGIGRVAYLKPLQQCLGLRVVLKHFVPFLGDNGNSGLGKHFHGITCFKVGLASLACCNSEQQSGQTIHLLWSGFEVNLA